MNVRYDDVCSQSVAVELLSPDLLKSLIKEVSLLGVCRNGMIGLVGWVTGFGKLRKGVYTIHLN